MRLKTLWITLIVASVLTGIAGAVNGTQNRQAGNQTNRTVTPLTEEITNTILYMREEEKLARDIYLTLDDLWDADVFANIAASEQRHMDAIGRIITLYGLEDPVADHAIGIFTNNTLAAQYKDLINKGSVSLQEALQVGVLVEQTDIQDLEKALLVEGLPTTVQRVYTNLLAGSHRHLEAFETCLATGNTTCSGLACNGEGVQARRQHRAGERLRGCRPLPLEVDETDPLDINRGALRLLLAAGTLL